MHWIRVERYWEGEFPDVRLKFRPVMCQQCDAAPCEPVCPTYASHHTDDGLNAQVYNRCIGTRYCANACPYNVRFFDFFNPQWDKPLHLQLNPDVSVREVGVMEKCTFCVQRIQAAQIDAKAEKRELKDGEIKPACVQACSARALVFGDLNDPESEVSRLSRLPRGASCSRISARCRRSPIFRGRPRYEPHMSEASARKLSDDLLRPLLQTSWRFYALVAFLGSIVADRARHLGLPDVQRLRRSPGINNPIFWAFYITNFVFWIGISHAGTLISAILRLVNAGWRRPVTRCAEVITAFALMIGALFPIIHLGRPWLFFWLMPYPSERLIWPNFRSPLVWDFFAITTYLTGSLLFLLLPMIPDFALVRDRTTGMRQQDLRRCSRSAGSGTPKQWHRLESAMQIMAIAIIPVAVSVHTIVSFDFSMAPVPMWHSTIFGPYFVAGAIFSGIAGLIIAMAALRKFLHLEEYLHPVHFQNLGKLLLLMSLLWALLRLRRAADDLVRQRASRDGRVLNVTQTGLVRAALLDDGGLQLRDPVHDPLRSRGCGRLPAASSRRSASCVGMWLERFLIVVPSLGHKYLPYTLGHVSARSRSRS